MTTETRRLLREARKSAHSRAAATHDFRIIEVLEKIDARVAALESVGIETTVPMFLQCGKETTDSATCPHGRRRGHCSECRGDLCEHLCYRDMCHLCCRE